MERRNLSSPAALFDAAIDPDRDRDLAALGFDVVARPGEPVPFDSEPGLLAIRRGLGENRLAVVSSVNRVVESRGFLEAEGVACEGYGEGIFAEIEASRARRRALRIAGLNGLMLRDTLLLRPRRTAPAEPVPEPAVPRTEPDWDFNLFDDRTVFPEPPAADTPSTARIEATQFEERESAAEAITDPIPAPRTPLAISGGVGRAGRNDSADVKAVQDRLVELRVLEAADATSERPPAAGAVADAALAQTIEAIERFQRQLGIPVDGVVEVRSPTRTELDQAIAHPTSAELSAVATERNAIGQTMTRGLTIKGAVGATASGNAPDDVRAVQRRLVDVGRLSASHGESPAAAATGAVPQASLRATIAALRALQSDVQFWVSKGTITGTITRGVVSPGDATATLLDRISVYNMTLGSTRVSFRDHVASGNTRSEAGVLFVGTASPSAISLADYRTAGLSSPGQAAALKLVSTQEGSFDAINTYDRALVSVGFIQFAGGRGLPRYLALLKVRQAAKFRDLLQKFGIDVEFIVARGTIDASRMVVLDPDGNRVLRATAAEAAIRDDKRLTTALIVSGRDRDVQLTQIEAAVRDYVLPIMNAVVSLATKTRERAPLKALFQSQKGMAALFDRSIQEGLGAARRRFERVIQRVALTPEPTEAIKKRAPLLAVMQRREGDILAEVERDLQAAADVADRLSRARALLATLISATSASGATLAGVLARPELADARRAVTEALGNLPATETGGSLPAIVNVTTPSGVSVEAALTAMATTLTAEERRLALTPSPPSLDALRSALVSSRQALATALGPVSTSPMFLARIQRIRRSALDSGLGPAETEAIA